MAEVALHQVVKKYGDVEAVRAIDLDIPDNEFVVLVGPSGCGKSTTLRMIAGLEEITSGDISIGGEVVNDLPPKDRDIAMVFQNYALYPHMTAYENMSFGLKLRKFPKAEIKQRVEHAARILDITELLERRPKALSGGQRQRVAMGRAIVRNPKVFLFDEPLSNLDAKLRVQMRTEIKRVHQKVKTTTVYVTHDQVEAMTLADRVVVMNNGRIEQIGTPQELYHNPKTRFVAGFIGSPAMNFIPCTLEKNGADCGVRISDTHRAARAGKPCGALPAGRRQASLLLGLRPEHVTEPRHNGGGAPSEFTVTLDVVEPMGMETMVFFTINGAEYCGRPGREQAVTTGSRPTCSANATPWSTVLIGPHGTPILIRSLNHSAADRGAEPLDEQQRTAGAARRGAVQPHIAGEPRWRTAAARPTARTACGTERRCPRSRSNPRRRWAVARRGTRWGRRVPVQRIALSTTTSSAEVLGPPLPTAPRPAAAPRRAPLASAAARWLRRPAGVDGGVQPGHDVEDGDARAVGSPWGPGQAHQPRTWPAR